MFRSLAALCLVAAVSAEQEFAPVEAVARELSWYDDNPDADRYCVREYQRLDRAVNTCARRLGLEVARAIRDARTPARLFNYSRGPNSNQVEGIEPTQTNIYGVALQYFRDNNINDNYRSFTPTYRLGRVSDDCKLSLADTITEWETCETEKNQTENLRDWAFSRWSRTSTPGSKPNDWWLCGSENDLLSAFCVPDV